MNNELAEGIVAALERIAEAQEKIAAIAVNVRMENYEKEHGKIQCLEK